MTAPKLAVDLAEELVAVLGHNEFAVLGALAEASRRTSRPDSVTRWTGLARALPVVMDEIPQEDSRPSGMLWRMMQIIERCRHRAVCAEQRAESVGTQRERREFIDIAAQWGELALVAELLEASCGPPITGGSEGC